MKNNIYKGYIASRSIYELQIPQRIQNLVTRLYCEKLGKTFNLSATEYIMDNCFMILKALAEEADHYEAIVFYSLFMLPRNKNERLKYYLLFLSFGTEIHFAFEELSIKSAQDIQLIEDILLAKELSQISKSSKESPWHCENL